MSERCPLLNTIVSEDDRVPEVCQVICGKKFDGLEGDVQFSRDEYPSQNAYDAKCTHDTSEHAHEHLSVDPQNPSKRIYQSVDSCQNCGVELGEDVVIFTC